MKRMMAFVVRAAFCWAVISVVKAEEPASGDGDFRERGDKVAAALFGNLGTTLQKQIATNGVEAAIGFCKASALPLTAATAAQFEGIQSVRRIGVRTRNPANLPDPDDAAAIAEILKNWESGAPKSEGVLREVKSSDGGSEVRYYKPVVTLVTCLACHGRPEQIPPAVQSVLRNAYPSDQAVNFAEGDLRGAIVVTFAKEPAAP